MYFNGINVVPKVPSDESNPCVPSPCGPNSQCRLIGSQAACSCIPNYLGRPPNCRPECTLNAECPSNKACTNERCIDPCPGSCGQNAVCNVINHNPICTCSSGFEGNPLTQCTPALTPRKSILILYFTSFWRGSPFLFFFSKIVIFILFSDFT